MIWDEIGKENETSQEKWDRLVNICHEATAETADEIKPKLRSQNPVVMKLSQEQKQLNSLINSNIDQNQRTKLRKERNRKLYEIQTIIQEENSKLKSKHNHLQTSNTFE